MLDWNAVRNATLRALNMFFRIGTNAPGRWHKVVTCQEAIRQKRRPGPGIGDAPVMVDERRPMLAGQGGVLAGAGFDIIIETRSRTRSGGERDEDAREYVYVTESSDLVYAKKRGFRLDPVMPGDMGALWSTICSQLGIPLPSGRAPAGAVGA